MKKRIFSLLTVLILCLSFAPKATATEAQKLSVSNPHVVESVDLTAREPVASPKTNGYYYWKVDSVVYNGISYGGWMYGPSGTGPMTITLNQSVTVSNSISGQYSSTSAISAAVGFNVSTSWAQSASASVVVPRGKRYQITYRTMSYAYIVTEQQYYKIDGYSVATGIKKVSYPKRFFSFDYSHVER
ncbi:MAG: hypothetical protein IJQ21_13400 [Lachnospiraceae bacterium]|nr:hypothetical protein [Lachnospiraceae bacterium]